MQHRLSFNGGLCLCEIEDENIPSVHGSNNINNSYAAHGLLTQGTQRTAL